MREIVSSTQYETFELEAVVFCLSGGGTKLSQVRLAEAFEKLKVSFKVFFTNDALATAFTAFENGKKDLKNPFFYII